MNHHCASIMKTRIIIVHRSEDVIFSARTKKCCSCIVLSTYISINLSIYVSISIYLYIYIIQILWTCLTTNCDVRYDPPPPCLYPCPCPHAQHIYIYLSMPILCSFIYISIYISIWKLSIYVSTLFIYQCIYLSLSVSTNKNFMNW